MKVTLGCKHNINGNRYQIKIDTDKKIYQAGYNIAYYNDFTVTKKDIKNFIKYELETSGYKAI